MQNPRECGKLLTVREGGFVVCPECERQHRQNAAWRPNLSLLRVTPETQAKGLPVWCRKCRKEFKLDIQGLSVSLSH